MKIGIVSGSIRNGRKSHRVALALVAAIKDSGNEPIMIDLLEHALSRFTERINFLQEEERSKEMQDLATLLNESEAIVFVTPEYNGGIAAALKQFIDTMDRKGFSGKPIAVASVSDGVLGGIRAAMQLQQTILAIQAYPQPQMLTVGEVSKQFDENGVLINPDFDKRLTSFVSSFIQFSARFKSN